MREAPREKEAGVAWFKRYVLGLAIGSAAALYGAVALLLGKTFLPGLPGSQHAVTGPSGYALAGGYLLGGSYLLVRFCLERALSWRGARPPLYALQNILIAGFVACLIYVLLHVGAAQ